MSRHGFTYSTLAVLCGAAMIACGDSPAEPDDGLDSVPVALDVSNEDGEIGPGFFSAAEDGFEVGEGGSGSPNALVYEIVVTNNLATPVHEIVVTDDVAPHSGILSCAGILDQDPAGGANPNNGSILGPACALDALVWQIGRLDGGESAVLYLRAEALEDGDDVNRVTVSAEGLASEILIEEPTLVGGPGPALSLSVADGDIVNSAFSSAVELNFVGDGSSSRPNALIYEIIVTNNSEVAATGVEVSATIPRAGGGLGCGGIREGDPAGGTNPNIGLAACTIQGVGWVIGSINPGEAAILYVRIEALSPGNHVSRVTLRADALSNDVRRDELTTVVASLQ